MNKSAGQFAPDRPAKGLKLMSFFTGAGGLDIGFEQAGFETVYATDLDAASCNTLLLNVGTFLSKNMKVQRVDIRTIDPSTLPGDIDLIVGGPPCQSFSASGRRAGGAAGRLDQRGHLFESYCRIVGKVRPKAFVFENVRGILGTNKGSDWKAIVSAFGQLGYKLSYRILDALDYGAPQQRERMFLVGHELDGEFLFPEPTHGPDSGFKSAHVTAGEALSGISETEDLSQLKLSGGKYSHLLPLVPPGQNYLFFTAKRGYQNPIFAYRSRFSDFLYKASPDAPIKTLIASPGKYTGPLHWDNRYFSVREYMRLQGFPDGYQFSGSREDAIRQIGNSVSPKIAYQIALAVAKQVFGREAKVALLAHDRALSFDKRKGQKAQKTRRLHSDVEKRAEGPLQGLFSLTPYKITIDPSNLFEGSIEVVAALNGKEVTLKVLTDQSNNLFAKTTLSINQTLFPVGEEKVKLHVYGYGIRPLTIQAMWDAVDDWVTRSSNFHSLFELYGHFTEPHPLFSIENFEAFSKHPIAEFARHASDFSNCSRYLSKNHLVDLFGKTLETRDFTKIANYLRAFRFDIRSKETNVAISPDKYMVAYPFCLPKRKQMNFKLQVGQAVNNPLPRRAVRL